MSISHALCGHRHMDNEELLECEVAQLRAEVELGKADLSARLSATVHALGGEVEGLPTGQHNYLQRIRALRSMELQLRDYEAALKYIAGCSIEASECAQEALAKYTEKQVCSVCHDRMEIRGQAGGVFSEVPCPVCVGKQVQDWSGPDKPLCGVCHGADRPACAGPSGCYCGCHAVTGKQECDHCVMENGKHQEKCCRERHAVKQKPENQGGLSPHGLTGT